MLRNIFISHNTVASHGYATGHEGIADYYLLAKPEITLLGVIAALGGGYLVLRGDGSYLPLIHIAVGSAMVGGGAGALNEYVERRYDAMMKRTMHRPIPTGAISPEHGRSFGILLSIIGVLYLAVTTTLLSAALAAATIIGYVLVYTPLKRRTPFAIVIGGVPGALPPLIGWTAAGGAISIQAMSIFFIVFFWQMPHFLALAWMYRKDYERAGYKVLTVVDPTGRLVARQILIYTAALLPASILPAMVGLAEPAYVWLALGFSVAFLSLAIRFLMNRTNHRARQLFIASLIYLPVLLIVLVIL